MVFQQISISAKWFINFDNDIDFSTF